MVVNFVQVEKDAFCCEIIQQRIRQGLAHAGPVYKDIQTFVPSSMEAKAKAICGGFPCQGVCRAGGQRGVHDPRTGLIREVFRLVDLCPSVCFRCS